MFRRIGGLVAVSLLIAGAAFGKGKPTGGYTPSPSVAIFGGVTGTKELLEFPDGSSTVSRAISIPAGGAWLWGQGNINCDQSTGIEATISPQLGETYIPLFQAGAEGCYQSFACPWCWRLLWGGTPYPRYPTISGRNAVFLPEGTTVVTLRAMNPSSVNSSLGLFLGQWNVNSLQEMRLSQAVNSNTAQLATDDEVANRVFISGNDAVPLLVRFFNADGAEEYSVSPGTKIEYSWDRDPTRTELLVVQSPQLFVANIPVPDLGKGNHKVHVYATTAGDAKTYQAEMTVAFATVNTYLDADGVFKQRAPEDGDDLAKFVPGSDPKTGASVIITEAQGQNITLWVNANATGTVKAEIVSVSHWPGIAMNYPATNPSTDADIVFDNTTPDQMSKPVGKRQEWADFPLIVRDYAAKASIKVTFTLADGRVVPPYMIKLPVDNNGNDLPDAGWRAENALIQDLGRAAGSDEDNLPEMKVEFPPIPSGDAGAVGDNLTNFEEYRGFVVRGAHRRTNPFFKDLFVEADQFGGDILYAYPGLPIAVHRVEGTDLSSSGKINLNAAGLPGSTSPWPNGHRDMQAQRVVRIDAPSGFPNLGRTLGQNGLNEPLVPNLAFDCEIFMDEINIEKEFFGASDDDAIELRRYVVAHEVGHAVNLWHNLKPEFLMFGGPFRQYQTFAGIPTTFMVNIPETYLTETPAGPELLEPIPERLLDPCQKCGMTWDDNGQESGSYGYPVYNFAETDTLRLKEQR